MIELVCTLVKGNIPEQKEVTYMNQQHYEAAPGHPGLSFYDCAHIHWGKDLHCLATPDLGTFWRPSHNTCGNLRPRINIRDAQPTLSSCLPGNLRLILSSQQMSIMPCSVSKEGMWATLLTRCCGFQHQHAGLQVWENESSSPLQYRCSAQQYCTNPVQSDQSD